MAKLRIEFTAIGGARGRLGGQVPAREAEPLGATTLDVTASATSAGSRPVVPSDQGTIFADLLAVDAAIYVDVGVTPDPTVEPRLLLLPGRPQRVHALAGTVISAILATDVAAPYLTQDQPLAAALTDRSGTIVAAGTAQQACAANAARRFLLVANPDDTRTIWFNPTAVAANGAGSLQVGAGAAILFDKVVPSGAVSVYGATAGQPFTVKEA